MLRRMMGKASFTTIQDFSGRIQLYVRADEVSNYDEFKNYDLGDIVGIEGIIFKTNTGELSIHVKNKTFNQVSKTSSREALRLN